MPEPAFKKVLEFFQRSTNDTMGQTTGVGPEMLEKLDRFLNGALPEQERALFFREVRLKPEAIELMAKQIHARIAEGKGRRRTRQKN